MPLGGSTDGEILHNWFVVPYFRKIRFPANPFRNLISFACCHMERKNPKLQKQLTSDAVKAAVEFSEISIKREFH